MKPKIGAWFDPQYMALWFYEGCDAPEDGASYPAYCIALTENAPIHDGGIPEHCFGKLIYVGPSIERGARSASRNPRPDPRFGPQTPDAPLIDVPGYNGPERRKTKRMLRALRRWFASAKP